MSVLHGDCREVMATMDANSVDAIVTDPPYGLSFMGKGWDKGVPGVEFWQAAIRVMKPGAYLLAFGGTRTFHRMAVAIEDAGFEIHDTISWLYGSGFPKHKSKLKPAWEPIIVARKPAPKATPLNVDACRIGVHPDDPVNKAVWTSRPSAFREGGVGFLHGSAQDGDRRSAAPPSAGRWPSNVVLDDEAGRMVGDAARFFYTANASRSERNAGLEGMPEHNPFERGGPSHNFERMGSKSGPRTNGHPTVKPISLMRWLVRLVTPTGGTVLDPFAGSGTTGCAASLEGFNFIGIEQDAEYVTIAERRIAHWARQPMLLGAD